MARRAAAPKEDLPEPDRIEGHPHPRQTFRLTGQDAALTIAARAIRSGRPPQAWLISGPPGIGKATLAYRIARYLLAFGASAKGPQDLSVPEKDGVTLQVTAGAHPGLLVLKRAVNDRTGKLMTVLSVDEVRKLSGFFGMTSGAGGWRVAIIDTADDMNDAAANALLKMLEEPPANAMLLLLTNAPGRLLPTIRSRCQRLQLRPLDDADLVRELDARLPDMKPAERKALVQIAGGSLGLALQLSNGDGLELARDAAKLIDGAANPDIPAIVALADRVNRMTDGLDTLGEFLAQALSDRIRQKAHAGAPNLDRWTTAWEMSRESIERTTGLHLEPRQTLLGISRALSSAARRSGAV
ncbi:MAG TPA: DNA polymerase III subunit delta' [Rhizomicrobium sp.]|jgi:DNA polymerase-3 subunit delta'